jgi:hypothetical protein
VRVREIPHPVGNLLAMRPRQEAQAKAVKLMNQPSGPPEPASIIRMPIKERGRHHARL